MKILEQLWHDGLYPSEAKPASDSRYLKQLDAVTEMEDRLLSAIPENAKELYEKYTDIREELSAADRAGIFTAGFRMGARIMLEVMEQEDKK